MRDLRGLRAGCCRVLLLLSFTLVAAGADAAQRTAKQRADANKWLWLNERDAAPSTERNPPWGAPGGATAWTAASSRDCSAAP
jgi:hypothetical protein